MRRRNDLTFRQYLPSTSSLLKLLTTTYTINSNYTNSPILHSQTDRIQRFASLPK